MFYRFKNLLKTGTNCMYVEKKENKKVENECRNKF